VENIIFERYITTGNNQGEEIFFRLSANNQSPLALVQPVSIVMTEAFSFASPIITITFVDGAGYYFNVEKINTDEVFYLSIGTEPKDTIDIPIKISKISLKSTVMGRSDQVAYKISFVHQGWNELLNVRHNRSWVGKKYSEIVEEIATECGYDEIEVSPSRDIRETVIQPYWNNLTFLKWLQERSIPEDYDDHFEFGCDITGKFFFKSVSNIIDEQKANAENQTIPSFKMQSKTSTNLSDVESEYTYFTDFKSSEFYMDSVINGSGGTLSMYYDWDNGTFPTQDNKLSTSNSYTLSDYTSLHENHEVSKMKIFNGRNKNANNIGNNVLSSTALSMNQFNITIEGTHKINIGQLVEVLIEPDSEILKTPISLLYSGFYVVAGVTHIVALEQDNRFITTLDLARQGYDDKLLEGYVTTSLGKFVGNS
jgi:hypothetical protein